MTSQITWRGQVYFFSHSPTFCHLYQPGAHYLTCDRNTETGRTRTIPNPFSRYFFGVANELYHQLTYTKYWKDTEQYLHHNTKANQQRFPQHQETFLFLLPSPPFPSSLLFSSYSARNYHLTCDRSADTERENVLKTSSPLPPYSPNSFLHLYCNDPILFTQRYSHAGKAAAQHSAALRVFVNKTVTVATVQWDVPQTVAFSPV